MQKTKNKNKKTIIKYCDILSFAVINSLYNRQEELPSFSNIVDIDESFAGKAPRSKEHLALYCATVLNNKFPYPRSTNEYCVKNDHKSPLDALWGAYSEQDSFSIWYAMRGSGKTRDLAILGWLESVFKPHCWTTVLGGSLEQSIKAVAYTNELWNMPTVAHLRNKLLVNGQVAGRGFKTTHGSQFQALAASTKSIRGPHPQKLRLDEVDEMEEKIYLGALGQPKSNYGILDNVIISSTLHNAFGLMSEIIDNREEIGAKLYAWCINEVIRNRGFWTLEEFERKIRQCTKAMIDSEYLLKRPKVGETIFEFDSIDRAYVRGRNDIFEPKVFTEAGIDWGYSFTAFSLIQDPREIFRNNVTKYWEYIELKERCKAIAELCIKYDVVAVYCDSNPKDSNITLQKTFIELRCPTKVIPISFNKWKSIGINVLRFLLEKDKLNITNKIAQEKMKKYHYKNPEIGQIAKVDDHIPDSLIAWATSRYKILGI